LAKYGVILVVLGSMLWGTDSLFRRPLTRTLSPITIVYLEHCILAIVVLPAVINARRKIAGLNAKEWVCLVFVALGGSVAATSLFTFSIKHGNPSVTVLLQKTQPLFTLLLARWFLQERPGVWFWRLLLPALCGAYLVSVRDWRSGFAINTDEPLNLLAALGAASLWGMSTVFGRYLITRLPVVGLTSLRFVLALPVLAALFWLQPPDHKSLPADTASVASLAGMALIPGLAALLLYYAGLRSTKASLASIGELAFPVTAVIANWVLLDIRLAPSQLLGGIILVASVTLLTVLQHAGAESS
jgi:drug/metabolite transporter (DMT)-like permease